MKGHVAEFQGQEEREVEKNLGCPNVSLRVGSKIVRASKVVLATESKYFHGLFNFRDKFEDQADEIDLSQDVASISDLKLIVRFIHSGYIDITAKNVKRLVKMSAYFGIDKLERKCALFLAGKLTAENCLNYYYYISKHGSVLELFIKGYIETRFHDLVIHKDSVIRLTCEQLQFAVRNNLMRYCSKESIFDYLLKWMENKKKLTRKHLDVVTEVIHYFNSRNSFPSPPFQGRFSRNIIRLEEILGKHSELSLKDAVKLRDLLVEFQRKMPSRTKIKDKGKSKGGADQLTEEAKGEIGQVTEEVKGEVGQMTDEVKDEIFSETKTTDAIASCSKMAKYTEQIQGDNLKTKYESGKGEALFTLSRREQLSELRLESAEKSKSLPLLRDLDEETSSDVNHLVYDLCMYDPVSRTWYHLATFDEDTYLKEINEKFETDNTSEDSLNSEDDSFDTKVTEVDCKILFVGNDIVFHDQIYKYTFLKLNITNMKWRRFDLFDKLFDYISVSNEKFDDFRLVMGKNKTLYLVVSYVVCDTGPDGYPGKERNTLRFDGFMINPRSFCLKHIFKTEKLEYTPYSLYDPSLAQNCLEIQYSPLSNELLMMYASVVGLHLAFVVNLDPLDNKEMSCLLQPELLIQDIKNCNSQVTNFLCSEILVLDDRFWVVFKTGGTLVVTYEYKYQSSKLNVVESGQFYIPVAEEHARNPILKLCRWYYTVAAQDSSFWMLEGVEGTMESFLKKIIFNTVDGPVVEYHTPPPFDDPVSVYASKVNRKIFSKFKPMKHFLY